VSRLSPRLRRRLQYPFLISWTDVMIGGHATPASVRFLAIALDVRADILSMSERPK
jgi:hypothetical protein